MTTTHEMKHDVVSFFCRRNVEKMNVLELGVFKGHTTSVLAAMFERVIAVDRSPKWLSFAARHAQYYENVVFMALDTYVMDWNILRANRVDVAIIDADHTYDKVRADAIHVLDAFPDVKWVMFDDYAMMNGVKRAVDELVQSKVLCCCRRIGRGKDGRIWKLNLKTYSDPEAVICAPGARAPRTLDPFTGVPFLMYHASGDPLRGAQGIVSFLDDGAVETSTWGRGRWNVSVWGKKATELTMELPRLPPQSEGHDVWHVTLNRERSSLLAVPQNSDSSWIGLREENLKQILRDEELGYDSRPYHVLEL